LWGVALETVDSEGGLDEGALRVVAHVHGAPSAHSIVRGATPADKVSGLESGLGYMCVAQRMSHLFENKSCGGLEVQDVLSTRSAGLRLTLRGKPRSG
jgi:hypothetical protein